MPIQDFRCQACGKVSEMLVLSSEHTLRCPDCGSTSLERLISSYLVRTGS